MDAGNRRRVSLPMESDEPQQKRIKTEPTDHDTGVDESNHAISSDEVSPQHEEAPSTKDLPPSNGESNKVLGASAPIASVERSEAMSPVEQQSPTKPKSMVSPDKVASSLDEGRSDPGLAPTTKAPLQSADSGRNGLQKSQIPPTQPPLRTLTMDYLKRKYMNELEYMLREFRKLERQLLGAKGATKIEESAGSKERREKLHSFILHLEDTIRQIDLGCKAESQREVQLGNPETGEKLARVGEEVEEENVQKLEEHIIENLLPVKVRLKKQLAAQQGATRNPAGMPVPRRGMLQSSEMDRGKGTFAAAAELRRKQAEASMEASQPQQVENHAGAVEAKTQFGKPLKGGGSCLTQKLHGQTLGSKARPHGHGVGLSEPDPTTGTDIDSGANRPILYAGMTPGSEQVSTGVSVASSVHHMIVSQETTNNRELSKLMAMDTNDLGNDLDVHKEAPAVPEHEKEATETAVAPPRGTYEVQAKQHPQAPTGISDEPQQVLDKAKLEEEEKRRLRRKRKKRKLLKQAKRREIERQRELALRQNNQAGPGSSKSSGGRKKGNSGKAARRRGPRQVEYICALCSESYGSSCDYNPWWALSQHECPKCRKTQIPRVDISAPANAIEYHPALLAHADENGGGNAGNVGIVQANHVSAPNRSSAGPAAGAPADPNQSDSDNDSALSDASDDNLSFLSLDSDDSDAEIFASMTPAERAEHERFGAEYAGPVLANHDAARLLMLMMHASTCPCRHKSAKHRDLCRSIKFLMLHVRDCPGTTATYDVCPFPWCRKVKHLLYHLVSCTAPETCEICSPSALSPNWKKLSGLNDFRIKKYREKLICSVASSNSSICKPVRSTQKRPPNHQDPPYTQSRLLPPYENGAPWRATGQKFTNGMNGTSKSTKGSNHLPPSGIKLTATEKQRGVREPMKTKQNQSDIRTTYARVETKRPPKTSGQTKGHVDRVSITLPASSLKTAPAPVVVKVPDTNAGTLKSFENEGSLTKDKEALPLSTPTTELATVASLVIADTNGVRLTDDDESLKVTLEQDVVNAVADLQAQDDMELKEAVALMSEESIADLAASDLGVNSPMTSSAAVTALESAVVTSNESHEEAPILNDSQISKNSFKQESVGPGQVVPMEIEHHDESQQVFAHEVSGTLKPHDVSSSVVDASLIVSTERITSQPLTTPSPNDGSEHIATGGGFTKVDEFTDGPSDPSVKIEQQSLDQEEPSVEQLLSELTGEDTAGHLPAAIEEESRISAAHASQIEDELKQSVVIQHMQQEVERASKGPGGTGQSGEATEVAATIPQSEVTGGDGVRKLDEGINESNDQATKDAVFRNENSNLAIVKNAGNDIASTSQDTKMTSVVGRINAPNTEKNGGSSPCSEKQVKPVQVA